ncbi:MAG: autotransporter outer membrane beta-barrel domain-containing protein [Lysobacteraceae bacterium]|nr:MAG: autotransporter outer membrane beta-barrel domain-containing protein [Xanthomonadaceae bacterium]
MHSLKNFALRACAALRPTALAGTGLLRVSTIPQLALLSGLVLSAPAMAQSCAVGETPAAFGFTGGGQSITVPAGVYSATVYLSGAQGGAGRSGAGTIGGSPNSPGGTGGLGGRVRGNVALTPGETLSIWVGGQGSQAINPGGVGQGADGIGGGATDLRIGGTGIGNRVAIAGGGGGGGNAGWSTSNVIAGGAGGVGGGGSGGAGATVPGGPGPFGGGGGAVGTGGAGGGGCGGFPATAGNAANGDGGDSFNFSGSFSGAGFGGGGGGGAMVGAGGGGAGVGTTGCQQNWNGGGGGGAGGSSGATGLTAVTINNGVQAGNGAALICFSPTEFAVGGTASGQTGPVTLQLAATNPASSQQVVVAQAASTFIFPTRLPQGANWNVSVLSAPAGQLCTVNPSAGSAIAADVGNVALSCTTVTTTVSPATLPNGTFNAAYTQTLTASSANGAVAPYAFSITAGALPAGLTLAGAGVLSGTPTAAGAFNFTVQALSSNNFAGTRAYTLVVAAASQAITAFAASPAAPVYAPGGTFTVSATGGASGNPVLFASTSPAVCTVSGNTVSMQSAGNCALIASQAGNANYAAAPAASLAVSIGAGSQAISGFAASPAAPVYSPGGTFAVSATGGASTSPVLFASASPAVCTVSGNIVTMQSAGNCALTADQAGDANYSAAAQVTLDVTIGAAAQAISNFIANPAAPVFSPNGTFSLSATGGASTSPVVFASASPAVCTVSGNTVTMQSAGNCALTADQAGDANYNAAAQVSLNVAIGAGSQAITGFAASPAAPVFVANGTFTVSATGGASTSPVVFASALPAVCTVSGNTVTMQSAGTCTLTADQAGDANYNAAAQASLNVAIGAGSQAITGFSASPAAPVFVANGTFSLSASGGASTSPVLFASTSPAVCTVSGSTVTMLSAGACALTADQAGDANYNAAAQVALNVSIGAGSQAITGFTASPAAPVFAPNGTFALSASGGASTSPVLFASASPAVCTVSGNTVTMLTAGACALTADQAGDANYNAAAQVSLNVAIGTASQAINNFIANPAAPVFAPNGTFSLSASGGASTSPVLFASTSPAVCTVSGSTVTMLSAGTCALTADQAADANYDAAPQVSLAVTIAAASQAITAFAANPAAPVFAPNGTFLLSATGGASTSPVLFASTSPVVCTVSGNTVTMLSAGTCALTADQAGDANYTAAPQLSLGVAIGAAGQAITAFAANPAAPVFTPNGTFTLSASGGASTSPVLFASTSPAVCTVSGNIVTMLSAGNCALTADQAGDANYTAAPQLSLGVAIGAAGQAITVFAANPAAPVFTPNGTFSLSASGGASTSPVVFASTSPAVCTVSGNTATMLSAGTCALTANQAGDANYSAAAQVTLEVGIGAAAQAISNFIANPAAPVFTPNGTFSLSATAGASTSPVLFASTSPAVCTVSGSTVTMLSAGNCALTANQAGDANYSAAAQVTLDVAIGAAAQAISNFIANPAAPVFAVNGSFALSASGGASTSPVLFASTSPAVCTVSGSSVTMLSAGSCTLTANQAGDANYNAAAQVALEVVIGAATPALSWIEDIQKSVGEPDFDLPEPTSDSAGSFTFSSTNTAVATVSGRKVTIVGDGVTTLVATQAAAGSYTQASVSATLTVLERPDPTQDPGVVGGLQAQVDASVRFASAQQSNIRDRLRQQRYSRGKALNNGVSVNLSNGSGGVSVSGAQLADPAITVPKGWGLWTAGAITFGDRDGFTGSEGFDFLGYEHNRGGMNLTGYGRVDANRTRLDAYREHGLGIYDLAYGKQTIENNSLAVGLEGSYLFAESSDQVRPYWMVEYRDAFENRSDVALNYVVMPVASDYRLALRSYGDNALTYGAGVDMNIAPSWRLSLLFRREHAADQDPSSSFGLLISFSPMMRSGPAAAVANAASPEAPGTGQARP